MLAHIFYTVAQETIGDYGSASCLLDAYMKAANDQVIREHNKTKKELASYKVLSDFKETPHGWPLLHEFDDECQSAFRNTIGGWNDYNQSIIPLSRIDAYAVRAEKAFPVMWKHLTAIRFSGSRRVKVLIRSDDQWLAHNASFVLMSNDFLRFVISYRTGDSPAISNKATPDSAQSSDYSANIVIITVIGRNKRCY
jgi:hypothetical protein